MTANIPKFELKPNSNQALELRTFLKSCENVLHLYDMENNQDLAEFFKLITFRLGYNVQERITKSNFASLKDFESHLRTICHIKLNKGKLLAEIRNEHQRPRKLIAQGRSEYPTDNEFESEAKKTLKNNVKNELISIKLIDSNVQRFEELAEIALNVRALEELIKQLMKKISKKNRADNTI